MNPTIIGVKEATRLGPGGVPVAVLLVTWTAGTFGPFTEQTTFAALNAGTLMSTLQAKARDLSKLPVPAQSA